MGFLFLSLHPAALLLPPPQTFNITHSISHTQHHTHSTSHIQHHTLNITFHITHPASYTQHQLNITHSISHTQHHTLDIKCPSHTQHHTLDSTHSTSLLCNCDLQSCVEGSAVAVAAIDACGHRLATLRDLPCREGTALLRLQRLTPCACP